MQLISIGRKLTAQFPNRLTATYCNDRKENDLSDTPGLVRKLKILVVNGVSDLKMPPDHQNRAFSVI